MARRINIKRMLGGIISFLILAAVLALAVLKPWRARVVARG